MMRIVSFGVPIDLDLPDEPALAEQLWWVLPPGWQHRDAGAPQLRLSVAGTPDAWELLDDSAAQVAPAGTLTALADLLERRIRSKIALTAPDHVFVHAGVVELDGQAVVIPGYSFTGKTTLVGALLAAGCGYVSDEYAVLDRDGLVTPYPRPLSVRQADGTRRHVAPEDGGRPVDELLAPAAVVTIPRGEGPMTLVRGRSREAVMALINNTVSARARPAEAMSAAAAVARRATYWRGTRGDADEAAGLVMSRIRSEAEPPKGPRSTFRR